MKLHLLIGTLVAMVLVASCAAEPEEVGPATVAEDVATEAEKLAVPADNETDAIAPDGGGQEVLEAGDPASTSSTPPVAAEASAAVETDGGDSGEVADPPSEATEPSVPEVPVPELPEPGGPWTDPREPDFTKTVPPPQD